MGKQKLSDYTSQLLGFSTGKEIQRENPLKGCLDFLSLTWEGQEKL